MSEENVSDSIPEVESVEKEDGLTNFKSEMDRKLANVNKALEEQNKNQRIIMEQLLQAQQQVSTPNTEEYQKDIYEMTPKDLEDMIEKRVQRRLNEHTQSTTAKQTEVNKALNEIVQNYPEASDQSSELYTKIIDVHNSLDANIQNTGSGYLLAAHQAAASLGIIAKKYRKESKEADFSISGKGASKSRNQRNESGEVSPEMLELARAMGLDINKKEVRERLSKNKQRNFMKWS